MTGGNDGRVIIWDVSDFFNSRSGNEILSNGQSSARRLDS